MDWTITAWTFLIAAIGAVIVIDGLPKRTPIEVCFSPKGGCQALIIREIESA